MRTVNPAIDKAQPGILVNTRDHHLAGVVWEVPGSKGNVYHVTLCNEGFTCECMAFSTRRLCKHIKAIDQLVGED